MAVGVGRCRCSSPRRGRIARGRLGGGRPWITTRISAKFDTEDLLHDSNINVDTNDHVVTLHGTVLSAAGRRRAVEVAKSVEGVQRVVDKLTIGPKK